MVNNIFTDFKFEYEITCGVVIINLSVNPIDNEHVKCSKYLIGLMDHICKHLKAQFEHISVVTTNKDLTRSKIVFPIFNNLNEKIIEEMFHEMYLWVEYPEKYKFGE